MAINFFQEDIQFNLSGKQKIKKWLTQTATEEGFDIKDLNFIFCNDEYLYQMNVDYLDHHTYTDIITFDNAEEEKIIEGDIFISIERVRENAHLQKENFNHELHRVLSHGLFHLCGINDKSPEDKILMRLKENQALQKLL
ncbi:MAG: rRNA maturation RNase YbeY [Anditalea sp.]